MSDPRRRKRLIIPQSALIAFGTIDAEHRELVELINRACDIAEETRFSSAHLVPIYRELHRKFAEHFINEEATMEQAGFPGLEAHRAHHGQLLAGVIEISEHARQGFFTHAADLEVFFDGIIGDALRSDLAFKTYLEQNGLC